MDSALITGCSEGGLGSGIAVAFQKQGIHVFATARSLGKLSHLKDLPNVTCIQLDVTDKASIGISVAAVKSWNKENDGRLKYLVNNAGMGYVGPLLDGEGVSEAEKLVFETNVWGPLAMVKAFVPLLIDGNEHGKGGVVVNVGSSGGLLLIPWNGIYNASKAAMNLLSETMRLELEPLGVSTITVVAGIIQSNFHSNISTPTPKNTPDKTFHLAKISYYKSLENEIGKVAGGEGMPTSKVMSAEEFGRLVVRDVLAGKRGNTYTGTLGWATKWLPLLPFWFMDWYGRKRGALDKFKGEV